MGRELGPKSPFHWKTKDIFPVMWSVKNPKHKTCWEINCKRCCPHREIDHFVCIDCGKQVDSSVVVQRAMEHFKREVDGE